MPPFNSLAYRHGEPDLSELRALMAPAARLVERTSATILDLAFARRDGEPVKQEAAEAVVAAYRAAVTAYDALKQHLNARYPKVVNYPYPQGRSSERNIAWALAVQSSFLADGDDLVYGGAQ